MRRQIVLAVTAAVVVAALPLGAAAATAPDAPTNVAAIPHNASADVSWTAPLSDGGDPISSYTVTSSPAVAIPPVTGTPPATSTTVTGLTNGTAYTFTVVANNSIGASPASAPSSSVTPATVPGAPTSVVATRGDSSATVTWTAPASDGGSAILNYTVTSSPGAKTATVSAGVTSATVTGLTNGTPYTFTVVATNGVGPGPASAPSGSVTPATVPGAPTNVAATAGNTSATITWTAPASTGGSAILNYTVTSSPGAKTATVSASFTSATVTGLTNGTPYTFTVVATNAVGPGPASAPSGSVTPTASVPSAPTNVAATALDGAAGVSWTAPASDGGSPIINYTVTSSGGTTMNAGTTTRITFTGLTNGTAYTFTVTARNSAGTGPASAPSSSVTPYGKPFPPTGVTAAGGLGSATVTWVAANPNGSPITGYTVISSGGTTASALGTDTSATLTGLTNGVSYTFTVTATNAAGTGAPSTASNPVVPGGPTVSSLFPATGPYSGGTSVTITGTNFSGTPTVQFGPNPAINVAVASATSITATSPPGSGIADVRVTIPGATSPIAAGDRFTYTTKCLTATVAPDSPSPQPVGTVITFTTTPSGCPKPVFVFWLRYPSGNWVLVRPWGPSATWKWPTRLPLGTYTLHVGVNESGDSLKTFEALAPATFTVTKATAGSPCTSASLNAVPVSPQQSGTIITFTGSAVTCINPEYKFFVQATGGRWILGRDWGTANYAWNTAGNGATSYNVDVWVRARGSTATYQAYALMPYTLDPPQACTGATLISDLPSPQPSGAIVTFTAGAGTCSQPQYLFYVQAVGGPWILGKGWGSNTYIWITTGDARTTYNIDVWVRQNGSKVSYETYKLVSYILS